ncbi:MAG: T9SS type A sorting domain-containing protein [Flavobacteriales bacterium]|nr:T9SS type A sorting domain-containing protein [Flavobacteriales bacterium]
MKKLLLTFPLLICLIGTKAQSLDWAFSMGSSGYDQIGSLAVDNYGNIYTAGSCSNSTGYNVDFDPGPGTSYLVAPFPYSYTYNSFIQKFDSTGNLIWVTGLGNVVNRINSLTVDEQQNIYITGYFEDGNNMVIGYGNYMSTMVWHEQDIFVIKLDSLGNLIWAKRMGSESIYSEGLSIKTDSLGNVYTTGRVSANISTPAQFGPFSITAGGIFIQKQDSNGNTLWVKAISQPSGSSGSRGISLDIDNNGNIYSTGFFQGTADFDPSNNTYSVTSEGSFDIYILKLDSSGNFLWVNTYGSTLHDAGFSLSLDNQGDLCVTGYYQGTIDFDQGSEVHNLTTKGEEDIFILKMDTSGSFIWAKSIGSVWTDLGSFISNDKHGNIYVNGHYRNTVDFDPNIGISNLIGNGSASGFILKLDSNGNFVWVKSLIENAGSVTKVDNWDNLYIAGGFNGIMDISPDTTTHNLTAYGTTQDMFLVKWRPDSCSNLILVIDSITNISCDNLIGYAESHAFNGNSPYTYSWNTNPITTSSTSPFDSSGTYELTIIDSIGCYKKRSVYIEDNTYSANFLAINYGQGNFQFFNNSTGAYNQSHWAFGDGTTSTLTSPYHTFSTNGTFVVVLTINDSTSDGSCIEYYLDTINVTGVLTPLQCVAGFVMYPDTIINNVVVINSSIGVNLSYLWNFGDSSTSTLQFPNHTYATSGPYYLCLTIDDGIGCVDIYCDSIGEYGVVFNKQTGFTINVIPPPNVIGIDDIIDINSTLVIYPNPASTQLTIETGLEISQITIIDITSKTIKTIKQNSRVINVSDLSNGIYFIRVITDKGTITQKFVKQ